MEVLWLKYHRLIIQNLQHIEPKLPAWLDSTGLEDRITIFITITYNNIFNNDPTQYVCYIRCSVSRPLVVCTRRVRCRITCDHVSLWEKESAPFLEIHITTPLTTPPITSKARAPTSQLKAATWTAHGSPPSLWRWRTTSGIVCPPTPRSQWPNL